MNQPDASAARMSYPLRMPPDMRQQLEEWSRRGFRSLHSEIIRRLAESLERDAAKENAPAAVTAEAPI